MVSAISSIAVPVERLNLLYYINFRRSNWRFRLWFGIYYGIMLAMFLYNLILLISLREINRVYYLLYLICMNLLFLGKLSQPVGILDLD